MLLADRYLGFHFFTNDAGGNPMMYINLIWIWGHPEVYILMLPMFGVYSEVVATFSGKPLFGYRSMVRPPWLFACSRAWSGCIISLPWEPVRMSTASSAS
jgi:heme/copper-type cytochrome/quinol oxidase subunit 1